MEGRIGKAKVSMGLLESLTAEILWEYLPLSLDLETKADQGHLLCAITSVCRKKNLKKEFSGTE